MSSRLPQMQPILAGTAFLAVLLLSGEAFADTGDRYSVNISNPMDIGQVAAASRGVTTFQVVPSSGQVNLLSGEGRRLSNPLSRVLVTITCTDGKGQSVCGKEQVTVVIGSVGLSTARALPLTNFKVSMTSASLSGGVLGANPITFRLNPIGANQSKAFYVGADFPVAGDDGGRSTGTGIAPFYVSLLDESGDLLTYTVTSGVVTAYRALTISKTDDLQFGAIGRPKTSGSVTLDPNSGARTTTGGAIAYPLPAWSPAAFTISGEGGQAFSVSVPGTIQLNGPTNINIQTITNLPASPTLSGSLGGTGSFTLKVGGALPVANGSLPGSYSGVFAVTVNYN